MEISIVVVFPWKSVSEEILKICLHLENIWPKTKCTTFFWTRCSIEFSNAYANRNAFIYYAI